MSEKPYRCTTPSLQKDATCEHLDSFFFSMNNLFSFNKTKGCSCLPFRSQAGNAIDRLHVSPSSVRSKCSACGVGSEKVVAENESWASERTLLLQGHHRGASGNRTCPLLPNGEEKAGFVARQMEIQITRLKPQAQNNALKCGGGCYLRAFQSASAISHAL